MATAIIAANILSSPYAEPYSTLTVMAFPLPVWLYPLLSVPVLISFRALLIGPIAIVIYPIVFAALDRLKMTTSFKRYDI
jgi:hypothetical protein